jgi:hypothetical protein
LISRIVLAMIAASSQSDSTKSTGTPARSQPWRTIVRRSRVWLVAS